MREMVQYSINIMRTVTCIVLQHCTSQQNTFGRQSSSVTLTTLHWNYNNGNGENFFLSSISYTYVDIDQNKSCCEV